MPDGLYVMQAELAAALLEEEWPDQKEAAAARAAAREAATPVPERVWALRNVGAPQRSESCTAHCQEPCDALSAEHRSPACLAWQIWKRSCPLYTYPHES